MKSFIQAQLILINGKAVENGRSSSLLPSSNEEDVLVTLLLRDTGKESKGEEEMGFQVLV